MAVIVVGISGASGVVLGFRLAKWLAGNGHTVELVISRDAPLTAVEEMGKAFSSAKRMYEQFSREEQSHIRLHSYQDFGAPIASGSFPVDACVIIPCSMATLSAIASGLSDNLLRRAADVALKEGRKLVLVPREMPFSAIHLENMLKLARLGVSLIVPQPSWYAHPKSIEDVEDGILSKVLDVLGIEHSLSPRWGA